MKQYHEYLETILRHGFWNPTRTGIDCLTYPGYQMRFPLSAGFPIVTTKFTAFKTMSTELCWFLRGGTNVKWLQERKCHIWDEWADENGDLGPVYGAQWRSWGAHEPNIYARPDTRKTIDQIAILEDKLKNHPMDRRMIVSAWNVGEIDNMALPPCHMMFQCLVHENDGKNYLSLQMYQRSCDSFLGVPFNISSYALLTHILAYRAGMVPWMFIWVGGDCHIYRNHLQQVDTILQREPLPLPRLVISPEVKNVPIDELDPSMWHLEFYQHHGKVEAPVAV